MELTLIKQFDNSFKLAYDSDLEKAKKLKPNSILKCKITRPRNVGFHRKYFALIEMIYQNQSHYKNRGHLRIDLQKSAGFYTERVTVYGEVIQEPTSISFSSMDEDEFQNLYSRVLDEIVTTFHFDKQDIIDNVNQYF